MHIWGTSWHLGISFNMRTVWATLLIHEALSCSNLLIGKGASGTGSPQIAYTSDAAWQYGGMGHYPAGDHAPGTMRQIFNEDTGAFAGEIPEAAHTYNAVAFHGGMNEHQLAISETTFGGLKSLR
jgi:dipeptidase